jgi:hypothetical protein
MTIDSIALWLGYGVMLIGGATLVFGMLVVAGLTINAKIGLIGKYLKFHYDLKTLRATMRQLEAEGKVRKKTGVQP